MECAPKLLNCIMEGLCPFEKGEGAMRNAKNDPPHAYLAVFVRIKCKSIGVGFLIAIINL